MSLLSRLTHPRRQQYSTKVVTPEENKVANPETPIPDTSDEPVQICAACGKPGAINNLTISYFGYITLPFVYLCNDCESARIEGKQQHYTDLHRKPIAAKETVEVAALEKAKPARARVRKVALVEQGSLLEERAHNLGA